MRCHSIWPRRSARNICAPGRSSCGWRTQGGLAVPGRSAERLIGSAPPRCCGRCSGGHLGGGRLLGGSQTLAPASGVPVVGIAAKKIAVGASGRRPLSLCEQTIGARDRRLGDRLGLGPAFRLGVGLFRHRGCGRCGEEPAGVPAQARAPMPQRGRDRGCPGSTASPSSWPSRGSGRRAPPGRDVAHAFARGSSGLLERFALCVALPHLVRGRLGWASGFGERRRWRRERALSRFRSRRRRDRLVIVEGSSGAGGTAPFRQTVECPETVGRRPPTLRRRPRARRSPGRPRVFVDGTAVPPAPRPFAFFRPGRGAIFSPPPPPSRCLGFDRHRWSQGAPQPRRSKAAAGLDGLSRADQGNLPPARPTAPPAAPWRTSAGSIACASAPKMTVAARPRVASIGFVCFVATAAAAGAQDRLMRARRPAHRRRWSGGQRRARPGRRQLAAAARATSQMLRSCALLARQLSVEAPIIRAETPGVDLLRAIAFILTPLIRSRPTCSSPRSCERGRAASRARSASGSLYRRLRTPPPPRSRRTAAPSLLIRKTSRWSSGSSATAIDPARRLPSRHHGVGRRAGRGHPLVQRRRFAFPVGRTIHRRRRRRRARAPNSGAPRPSMQRLRAMV